jgi:hypothetical protein
VEQFQKIMMLRKFWQVGGLKEKDFLPKGMEFMQ